jgi:hypothetical protein
MIYQQLPALLAICSQLQCVIMRYTSEQREFLYDTYVKYGSAGKCQRKCLRKFHDERVPSR